MKKTIVFVICVSTGGIVFIVSMVRSRNLPIVKRIKLSGKQSLKAIAVGIGLSLSKGKWENVVHEGFIRNETPTVCTEYSPQNSNQYLSIKRSRLITSDDELEALGFANGDKNNKEVTLVAGLPIPYSSKQRVSVNQEPLDGLVQESHIYINPEQKPKILMIRIKSDLKNSDWIDNFISSLRGGKTDFDESLIRSILSKVSDSHWDIPSINKILQRIGDITVEIGSNSKLMRILAEFEKPMRPSDLGIIPTPTGERVKILDNLEDSQVASRRPASTVVEGWLPRLPRHRKPAEFVWKKETKCSTPSAVSLLDSTKCYGHREAYDMPREVSEQFETNAVKKLAKTSLRNPRFKKDYNEVKLLLKKGIHPVNINSKSTYVSADKVLVKKPEGRFLIDVSDTSAEIVGVSARTDEKCMAKFEELMNKLYDLDLKGY